MSESLTPRAWLGEAPFPWPAAHALPGGASVRACYYVRDAEIARTRQDQPYLRLSLSDRHGNIAARVWDNALLLAPLAAVGSYIGVQGVTELFNGELQLCVEAIAPLHVDLEDLALFLPCSPRDAAGMAAELEELLDSIGDPALRSLAVALLGADSHTGPGFRLAPAAKHNHHAYLGGLLEHTLSVTRLCQRLADHYGDALDRDLLVTAALLHDVGKVRELGARAGFPYTDEGKLLGHILLGLQMVDEAAARVPDLAPTRLLLLRHVIAAHQGRYEWQSPREPATLEALVLHYADDLDAKYNQVASLLAPVGLGWTPWDRSFRREFLRHRAPSVPPEAEVPASAPRSRDDPADPPDPPHPRPPAGRPGRDARRRPDTSAERVEKAAPLESAPPHPRRNPRRREDGAAGTSPENTPEGPARGSLYPRLSDDTLDLFERP